MTTLDLTGTALWQDLCETPETVAATLDGATGHAELAHLLASHRPGRIVATGNGASFYVATALWVASLSTQLVAPVVAIPAGLLATDTFTLRSDDLLLAFSTSGELRDLVELANGPQRAGAFALVTSTPSSTLAAQADVVALVEVRNQRAVTHTQAYLGAAAVALDVLGRGVGRLVAPGRCRRDVHSVERPNGWCAPMGERGLGRSVNPARRSRVRHGPGPCRRIGGRSTAEGGGRRAGRGDGDP